MGVLAGLVAALVFGANGSLIKVVMAAGLTPAQVTLFRTLGTAVLAGAVLLVTDRAAFRQTPRRLGGLVVLGVAGMAIVQWSYAMAVDLLPVGIALLIEYLAVLIVPLVALFVFRERIRARIWIAIVLVLAGLALVTRAGLSPLNPLGVGMALLAAAALTYFLLGGERLSAATSPMTVAFWSSLVAAGFWALFSQWWTVDPTVFGGETSLGGALDTVRLPMWVPLALVVALGTFLPMWLGFVALVKLKATPAGILASSEVIFAFAFAWVWLGESLEPIQVVGAMIVLVGIVLAQTARPGSVVSAELGLAPGPSAGVSDAPDPVRND